MPATTEAVYIYGIEANGEVTVWFYVLHILALVMLALSTLVSVGLVIYLFLVKDDKNLFNWPIGERLVAYVAMAGLFYSFFHTMDHSYMLALLYNPPRAECITFAFFTQTFGLCQVLIVLFTAFNAFLMVVKTKKIDLGKYDWRLFVYAVGMPVSLGIIGASIPFLGPSGAWCYVDVYTSFGRIINNVYSGSILLTIIVNLICYPLVWAKISQAAKVQNNKGAKYHKTAKVMMIFVAVFLVQWWAYVVYSVWSIFDRPHIYMMVVSVIFTNSGGILNFMAYIVIRVKYQRKTEPDSGKTKVSTVNAGHTSSSQA